MRRKKSYSSKIAIMQEMTKRLSSGFDELNEEISELLNDRELLHRMQPFINELRKATKFITNISPVNQTPIEPAPVAPPPNDTSPLVLPPSDTSPHGPPPKKTNKRRRETKNNVTTITLKEI